MTPRNLEAPSTAVTATRASTMIAKYDGAPSLTASSRTIDGANATSSAVPMDPATKDPIAAVASACAARPRLGHLVALQSRDHGRGFTGRVEQDRGGRAAIHAAVVDAGEHDEGARRLDVVGDREQQRHGHRRADARQHTHGRAEHDADTGVQQIHRGQRGGEAVHQAIESVHVRGSRPGFRAGSAHRDRRRTHRRSRPRAPRR
jgi:hypothetical protein